MRVRVSWTLTRDGFTTIANVAIDVEFTVDPENAAAEAEEVAMQLCYRLSDHELSVDELRQHVAERRWLGDLERPEEPAR